MADPRPGGNDSEQPLIRAGVVLAGGRSRRMGEEKAFLNLGGRPLIGWAIDNLKPQTGALAINANGDPRRFGAFGLPVIADGLATGEGPVAGIHRALLWAETIQVEWLVTVPADTPFLPGDLAPKLIAGAGAAGACAAIAVGEQGPHPLIGAWRIELRPELTKLIESRLRAMHAIADALGAAHVAFDEREVLNVNAAAELGMAKEILARTGPSRD